jgi:DNA polymerase III delta prime subunit
MIVKENKVEVMLDLQSKIKNANLPLLVINQNPESFSALTEKFKNDSFSLDGKTAKIADIRELIRWLSLKPVFGSHKLAIVLNAEKINLAAANALLKTLEEPPVYAKIVLVTSEEQKILPTIISRCLKVRLVTKADFTEPEGYLSPESLAQKTVQERFRWADVTSEGGNADKILILWQEYFRQKLLKGNDVLEILKFLAWSRDLLLTNISVKLLLENLTLNF